MVKVMAISYASGARGKSRGGTGRVAGWCHTGQGQGTQQRHRNNHWCVCPGAAKELFSKALQAPASTQ